MSSKSNFQGRAYEFACLNALNDEIKKLRPVKIETTDGYDAAKRAWNAIDNSLQVVMEESALAAVETLFELEPLIVEDGDDELVLKIQQDSRGEEGDVRDILMVRRNIEWEIGLSLKHNHFAVKHSRLSRSLDFGDKWFGVPCSKKYWEDIKPIFDYLVEEKFKGTNWSELPAKEVDVYIPLLTAFMNEVRRSNENDNSIPRKMVEYLLGEFDFYKVVGIDNKRITQIQTFNLHGTLNQSSKKEMPKIKIPIASLPSRIVSLEFKPNSTNTIELYMDGGWQFSFRIHNASTKVEPSLKFDVQILGIPTAITTIECKWQNG
ncbi:HaeIII family restriction endonuclease [Mogibacterium diversum]|uniref:HaeIII family restriction endonuclease n=1 Tax=Mogibacterium diversum TaxID=114527 RepID=UPI0028EF9720|nr:HaeIII family restriction endonuclease [Mogibacterium diversum]